MPIAEHEDKFCVAVVTSNGQKEGYLFNMRLDDPEFIASVKTPDSPGVVELRIGRFVV